MRVEEHNSNDLLAAIYTRTRRPVALVYQEVAATRSAALKREYEIKQMSRQEKEVLFRSDKEMTEDSGFFSIPARWVLEGY